MIQIVSFRFFHFVTQSILYLIFVTAVVEKFRLALEDFQGCEKRYY